MEESDIETLIDEYMSNIDTIGLPGENSIESYIKFVRQTLKDYTVFMQTKNVF